jgi:outer membrane murein-binding lipoprotein Lpp
VTGSDFALALVQTSDGGYAVAGHTASTGLTAGGDDQTLIKIDSSGTCSGVCTDRTTAEVDRVTSEVDRVTSEVDRVTSEVDRVTSEVDRAVTEVARNETLVINPNAGVQSNDTWAQTWGGTGTDAARALVQTSDGGYAVAGYTASPGLNAGTDDQTLVKYDSSGIEQWSKTWGGTGTDQAFALVQTSDGGFAVAGYTTSTGLTAGGFDQTLVKYDSSGVEQWSKTWGGTGNDIARALVQTSDGGYAVAGETNSSGLTAGGLDQTLVKYDSSGIEQWSKTWGGDLSDIARALVQTSDGGYAVAGETNSTGLTAGSYDQTLVKYDSSGIEQWSKTWGGTGDEYARALVQTSDGGYAVAGYTDSTGLTAGLADQTLVKYDSSGIEQWSKTWGGTGYEYAYALVHTSDGGYAVAGQTDSTGLTAGSFDQTLVKYDSSGVEQWSKTWGGTGSDIALALVQTSDGGYAVAGSTASTGLTAGGSDQTLLKFASDGTIADCPACVDRATAEVDRATAEVDRATTEVDRATTEVDRAVTEVNRDSPQTLVHCGVIGGYLHSWGGTGTDYALALVQTSDGGYAVAGSTASTGLTAGGNDQTLVKYDSSGIEQWSKTWGGDLSDIANALVQTSDGGYAVAGYTASTGLTAGGFDQTLVKYDSSGVEQWSKTWGGTGSDIALALVQTSDGGYAVAGSTASTGLTAGLDDQTLVKYDSSGVEQWSKTWGGTGDDRAYALVQTSDGGYAVAGRTASTGLTAGLDDQTLVKYDSSGVEQWSKTWGGTGNDYARALVQTSDGGFAVAGYTNSTGLTAGGNDQTLVKYDSSGVEQWSKTWGGDLSDYAYALVQTSDGGYAVAGQTNSTGLTAGLDDQTLVKYDSSGVEQWSKTWGGTGTDQAFALVQTSDGGFAVAGYTNSTGLTAGGFDQTLIKIDSSGTCSGVCTDRTTAEVDRVTSEVDRVTSEVDRVTSEVDRVTSEVDRAVTEVARNETLTVASYTVQIGPPLNSVAQNTATSLTSPDQEFRLRLLLHDTAKFAVEGQLNFKIQYAARVGTCDVNFVGESYIDVGTSTAISFNDNLYSSGDAITNSGNDPTHGSDSIIYDSYVESNGFTNRVATAVGSDSMWDFSLFSNSGAGNYCFRVVFNDGSLLASYSQIPELGVPPGTGALMRHGAWFNPGTETKEPFYW